MFDIFWHAPSFYIKLEISGKKLVSFKLELEMRGIEVRGTLRLKSSPYEPEKGAVSFVSVPQVSFGVGSHVIVGSVKLPFQRAIEKVIYTQIQSAIETGLKENVVGEKWVSIHYEKSGLSLQLDRWWSIAQYPFQYDGQDDEDMMSLALVVTTQAEAGLSETVKEMRRNRDRMQKYLGQRSGAPVTVPAASAAAAAAASSSSSSSSGASSSSNPTPLHSKKLSRDRAFSGAGGGSISERPLDSGSSTPTPSHARKKSSIVAHAPVVVDERADEDDDERATRAAEDDAPPPPPPGPTPSKSKVRERGSSSGSSTPVAASSSSTTSKRKSKEPSAPKQKSVAEEDDDEWSMYQ